MNLLLDTHVFIWFDSSTTQLSAKVTNLLLDREHPLYLSLVSIWADFRFKNL